MEGVLELLNRELAAVSALEESSESWSQAVRNRIEDLKISTSGDTSSGRRDDSSEAGPAEEEEADKNVHKHAHVHEKEVRLNNDDLKSLLEIDESFSNMIIELDDEEADDEEVEEELMRSVDEAHQESREGQLAMVGIAGSRMIQKLALGFSSFKNAALQDAQRKREALMDELDYVAVTDKLKKKAVMVQKLRDDLAAKRAMLDEKIAEEGMTAEELREKYVYCYTMFFLSFLICDVSLSLLSIYCSLLAFSDTIRV